MNAAASRGQSILVDQTPFERVGRLRQALSATFDRLPG